MTLVDRVLPKGILQKYQKKELKGNYNFTEGEYHLANYLDKKLPKEWIIHTKPTLKKWGLHMTKKTPDIVIAHKKFGIMIIEVKDYSDFNNFKKEIVKTRDNRKFLDIFYKDNKGRSKNINPVKQVEDYLWRMRDGIKEIIEEISENTSKLNLIKCGVYFHNEHSTAEAKQFVGYPDFLKTYRCNVFAKDMLNDKTPLHNLIPLLLNKDKIQSKIDWTYKFKNWISDPLHFVESKIIASEKELDLKQRRYTLPEPGVIQKLSGVAGSGKTKVISWRAAKLASLGKQILIVCFNITLKNYIEYEIINIHKSKELPSNIDIVHFHEFIKLYADERGIPYHFDENDDALEKETIIKCIRDKEQFPNETNNYDAILIDEGQDFKEEWFKFVRSFLNNNEEVLIAIDSKQNVYGRKKTELKGVGSGKWGQLNIGYRLNNLHIKIANNFSKSFLGETNTDVETPYIQENKDKQHSLPFDPDPEAEWINVSNIVESNDKIIEVLNYLDHEKKNEFSDTTILVSEHSEGINLKENILSEFKNKIKISDVFKGKSKDPRNLVKYKEKKKLFTVRTNKLKMCTIKSFKGWERRNIIILTTRDKNIVNDQIQTYDYEMYTSLTRVREKIFIINLSERYREFYKNNSSLFSNKLWKAN